MNRNLKTSVLATSLSLLLLAQAAHAHNRDHGNDLELGGQGPSSSDTPYLVPAMDGVDTVSILTAGDSVKRAHRGSESYRMVGIPDGMGAYDDDHDDDDDAFTVLMNHELVATSGIERAHGAKGAFVSKWKIRKSDLKVVSGEDLIQRVKLWDGATRSFVETPAVAFSRFCSGDLPKPSAFFNRRSGRGFDGRLYMNGEENGPTGRAFAHVVEGHEHGTSYQLPALGNMSFENVVANPYKQDKTILVVLDDSTPGKVAVYVGMKQGHGNPVEKAGLHGGSLFAIAVDGVVNEDRNAGIAAGSRFTLVDFAAPAATKFLRPEDGAWDTIDPGRFYFVTTDRFDRVKDGVGATVGRSRLWRLSFYDIKDPQAGGTIEMMLDGTEAGNMYDNITVDADGNVVLQEDVGNQAHNGKVWKYDPNADALTLVGKHDPAKFGDLGVPAASGFNQDEESSGVIEVTHLFHHVPGYQTHLYRYFLLDVQAHINISATDPEIVEKGQLVMMRMLK